ncbi:hypothetical protein [Bradyrhizobium ottawaense]|uniref:DUF3606 domain-containing protein n=1 Tax=Bradyrhizobium ottawaense TaxID=931866 RepID=A0ABY0QH42_9BRAD|nr:hypothetical protein [Bradyrhizobium ottawaense]SDK40164.1 hypothetical protein SAMN05444163_8027 [Bradyrhizobium ottawaense]
MAKNSKSTADQAVDADVRYEVKLSGRHEHLGFWYLPSHEHVVDHDTLQALDAAGVVADVKQLS